ncbi:MAG: Curved DNA-binding protein [Verrucomicrobiota bacterium]|jgi:curved DNA-binding protein
MAEGFRDYYEVLGVSRTATQEEVRKAFRKLARVHHPDVAKDKKTAEAKFKEINEAYEVLGDPENRRKYDQLGANWDRVRNGRGQAGPNGDPAWSESGFSGTGFSDFFEQFFGRAAGGNPFAGFAGAGRTGAGVAKEVDLLVTLSEALNGGKKKVSFRRTGKTETYQVSIPKGVRDGQRIRLAAGATGQGSDIYLRVRFEQHPDFRVEGSDLVFELEVPIWQAVLGGELDVPTPEGTVRLRLPEGAQIGSRFRIRGRGLPVEGGGRGDFYVRLKVSLPRKLSLEQRQAWERIRELGGTD